MSKAKLKVIVPRELNHFFDEDGYCENFPGESRRASRLRIRRDAAMRIESSPSEIIRLERDFIVLIKDISRTGIAFLCHEPIWKSEKVFLRFHGRQIRAEVLRCRQLGEACWECGGKIFSFRNLEG